MPDFILRRDIFPFICDNPACNRQYDVQSFINAINLRGLIYADCGDTIYQGITCECKKPTLNPIPRNNPIVDLRDFIITPNPHLTNVIEQVKERERVKEDSDLLSFKFIPAWDKDAVSYDEILKFYQNWFGGFWRGDFSPIDIPYILTPEDFKDRFNNEHTTGETKLRRLYPDIPKFRNLLTCMSPNWFSKSEDDPFSDGSSGGMTFREIQWRISAWKGLLEEIVGKPLKEVVIDLLQSREVHDFNKDIIDDEIRHQLFLMNHNPGNRIRELSYNVGFEAKVWDYVKEELNKFLYPVCTKISLDKSRKTLLGWTNYIEKGKALFVDAPMGLGKTYAIVEALVENPEMSAVIFMPTIRLCEEIVRRLRNGIHSHKNRKKTGRSEAMENLFLFESPNPKDKYGNDEVYYNDGINEKECPHFKEITKRYRENWIKKKDICAGCKNYVSCRFIFHWKRAPLSRIVVTTHHNYDSFYRQPSIRKWYKSGLYKRNENGEVIKDKVGQPEKLVGIERNCFIVDEDFVLSQCYQPISLNPKELKAFISTVTKFLGNYENTQNIRTIIHSFFGQIIECDRTAIISPIEPEFKIPKKIVDEWEKSFYEQPSIIPETLDWTSIVGNYLDVIQNAIQLGAVVEKWGNRHFVHLPNPKSYNLSRLPTHVFFDGTMLDDRFLEKKLKNVKFEPIKIDAKVPWKLKIWQNVNTDLPKKWIARDEHNVKKFVRELINDLGMDHKYFFITTMAIREKYLGDFLDQEYPNLKPVVVHYGSLRGINEANECDIGIMIGSCLISDTVEIAMALEFIQNNLPKQEPIPTESNLWTWKKSKSQRVYKDEYAIVGEMANAFRLNEHRQAIARTRYLFHDVDFYVLSKDPVDEYEEYATVKDYQYRSDIFPPRSERSDIKYEEVKKAVFDLIAKNGSTIEMKIHQETGFSRTTIRNHLKRMLGERELVREGTKYKLSLKSKDGQDSL